jgi:hypothetical protein
MAARWVLTLTLLASAQLAVSNPTTTFELGAGAAPDLRATTFSRFFARQASFIGNYNTPTFFSRATFFFFSRGSFIRSGFVPISFFRSFSRGSFSPTQQGAYVSNAAPAATADPAMAYQTPWFLMLILVALTSAGTVQILTEFGKLVFFEKILKGKCALLTNLIVTVFLLIGWNGWRAMATCPQATPGDGGCSQLSHGFVLFLGIWVWSNLMGLLATLGHNHNLHAAQAASYFGRRSQYTQVASNSQQISVTVPPTTSAGDTMQVAFAGGDFSFKVPEGACPGQHIMVNIPDHIPRSYAANDDHCSPTNGLSVGELKTALDAHGVDYSGKRPPTTIGRRIIFFHRMRGQA